MINYFVLGRIEVGAGHLTGNGHSHGITHPLTKRTCGRFDSRSFAKFRMSRRFAVQLAEVLKFFKRKIKTGQMEPTIEEHATVTC